MHTRWLQANVLGEHSQDSQGMLTRSLGHHLAGERPRPNFVVECLDRWLTMEIESKSYVSKHLTTTLRYWSMNVRQRRLRQYLLMMCLRLDVL